jgi:glutamine synthetase
VIFCVDDGIAFTPNFGAGGDMRLRTDLDAVADLGNGVAWAPTELADQDGEPLAFCPRGALRREQAAAEAEGLQVSAATEIEFVAFDGIDDAVAGRGGPAYGLAPLLEHASFVEEVHTAFARAGLVVEQFHAEYSSGQFEMSLAPAAPLQAADANVLARILLCDAARNNGLRISFSPRTFPTGVGNGAHVVDRVPPDVRCRVGPVRTGSPTTAPRSSPATSSGCLRWSEGWRHRCCPGCASSRAIGPGRTRAGVWRTARRPFACAPRRRATSGGRAPR